jgi:hypothetical protein
MRACSPAYDFKLALTRVVEPTGGLGAELATLEDAARFVGLMKPWRQARPHWDFAAELLLKAAETGKRRDVKAATAQMEFALRVEGWMWKKMQRPSVRPCRRRDAF